MTTGTDVPRGTVFAARPVPRPRVRLFLFHHAGGSHQMFRDWVGRLPSDWEICLTDAPGRGLLSQTPPVRDVRSLVRGFLEELLLWLDRPFAFFGHSMGALVAHELTLALRDARLPLPVWLGVSGRGCPRSVLARPTSLHRLPADRLRTEVGRMGGTPEQVVRDAELWDLLEPVLRADFELVETWRPDAGRALRVPVPLSAFGGTRDPLVAPAELAGWADYGDFGGCHLFEGGHFYFAPPANRVPETVTREIRTALTGMPAGGGPGAAR
ncbi:thioesterase II family protein [Streptomyces sp. SA15]|uniref:thioesterase II family protein n=1 Tax=Streptomyces sp. SA15 TaxID=934019 RepID=UPI00211CE89E|nr:alpha/beta fold hydrolase [Streptomyces sp. SA15]